MELKDNDDQKNITDDIDAIVLEDTKKGFHRELKVFRKKLSHLTKSQVEQFVKQNVSARELNTLMYNFYDAFRDVSDNNTVKFECMELLDYMGIKVYKEEDFVPYRESSSDECNTEETSEDSD